MSKTISLILMIVLCLPLWAKEAKNDKMNRIATISTDYIDKTYDLAIKVDDKNEITHILSINNKKNKIKTYDTTVLKDPIPLVKTMGVSLVTLRCNNFTPKTGCDINIEYPYNIAFGYFKNFEAKMKKTPNGKWALHSKEGKPFNQLHLTAKTFLGALLGVQEIQLSGGVPN
ncbi:MAG: hypothetical protein ACOCUH_03610 [Bacteriovoracia bacterium]